MTQNEMLLAHANARGDDVLAFEIPEEYTPGWRNYPGSDGNYTQYVGWYFQVKHKLVALWPVNHQLTQARCPVASQSHVLE